jgi:hypothetical protein
MMVFVAVVALGLAVVEEFQDGLPPRFVVRGIPRRIARLRPGMTPEWARELLGLERPWLLGGISASWKHGILNLGLINELYIGGGARIVPVFSEDRSGKLRLVRATVSSGFTTIAEMPQSRRQSVTTDS